MARFQTTVETIAIADGKRQPRALNMRVVEPVPSSPQAIAKGSLYVLLELGGAGTAQPALYRLVLNTIQGVYYDAAGGITGGITEAILAAHRALIEHNTLHPKEAQLGGISCAVLRGEELYLGVGGPAMVLIGAPERIDQLPAELHEGIVPLGGNEAPSMELFRTSITPGTRIVQLASEWVARVPMERLATAAALTDIAVSGEYLETIAPERAALSALLTRVDQAIPEPAPVPMPAAEPMVKIEEPEDEEPLEQAPEQHTAIPFGPPSSVATQPAEPPLPVEPLVWEGNGEDEDAPRKKRRWWLWLLLVPLLLALIFALGMWWQQRQLQASFDTLINEAQTTLQATADTTLPAEKVRPQLAAAKEQVQKALALFPDDANGKNLEVKIQERLDEVNLIVPLYKLVTLQPLGGEGSDPKQLIVDGSRVFIADPGVQRVLRYGLDEVSGLIPETSGGVLAERGQTLSDGQSVGDIVDIVWAAAGGQRASSNLLILDSNRNIIEVDPATGLTPLAVGGRDQWVTPRIMESYNGNLYLLDSGSGRILRYLATDDGYADAPDDYLADGATLDFSHAVDMAIDGNVWILYSDGTVQTFFQGTQQAFVLETPPNGPITGPQAIYTGSAAGAAESVYIVDSTNSRIVEYDKTGKYLRQFRPYDKADQEILRAMRDLQVDDLNGIFYLLTNKGLYRTDLPN